MSYSKRVLKRRPASLTDEEWVSLLATRFVDRGYFRERDGVDVGRVPIRTVLCPCCRERHSPGEVNACMAMAKPAADAKADQSSSSSARIGTLLREYSEIWEFLTKPSYSDGSKRLTGKISLQSSSAGLTLTLLDQTSNQYCCLTLETLDDLLLAFEVGLRDNSLPWRTSQYSQGNGKRK